MRRELSFSNFPAKSSTLEDELLVRELRKGSQKAFSRLIDDYQGKVFNTCLNFVHHSPDAEDLAQEVFLEVFRSINKFKGESKLSTWIYRIAVTKSLEFLRKNKRQKRAGQNLSLTNLQESGFDVAAHRMDHPGVQLENKERAAVLFTAVASLPDGQRIAFTLNKIEGRSYQEVSEIMEVSLGSVESLIFRARKNLKKRLKKFYKNDT